ncbi:transcriptional regulator [Bacillaceae bacterium Marseille-Q3522]|nr:transcriptional regulator [Bacillaceae bacterium Marseille-Q3522]
MTQGIKLRPVIFKHVEAELYDYPETKREIKKLREQIMFGSSEVDENVGGGRSSVPGRPTERIATRLLTDKRLRNLEEITEAIDWSMGQVSDECRRVIQAKYWEGGKWLTWSDVAEKCFVHRNTARKYRNKFVFLVAARIGWV